ncbi:hypothetical protein evm_010017 [Chilo suppressalis]|nr:hypothetical protein evm_010017 [Chilo suppressalis]
MLCQELYTKDIPPPTVDVDFHKMTLIVGHRVMILECSCGYQCGYECAGYHRRARVAVVNLSRTTTLGWGPPGPGRLAAAVRRYGLTGVLQPGRAGEPRRCNLREAWRTASPGSALVGCGQRRLERARSMREACSLVCGLGARFQPAGKLGDRRCANRELEAQAFPVAVRWGRWLRGGLQTGPSWDPLQPDAERTAFGCYNHDLYVDQVVEGVYSMEGSIAPLRGLVELKKRLGLQLYLDEAHSVGAIGPRGRGATDHCGVRPQDVDVLMGTFTKSFGAAGGYVAGSAALIRALRARGHGHSYATSMSPPVAAQVLWALRSIDSPAGLERIQRLRENTAYFRDRLRSMGVVMYGAAASPVVPVLVYTFSKMAATVERLARAGLATVGRGFPATPLNQARIRFCLSAAHTREQLEACAEAVKQVVDELGLHYSRRAIH